MNCPDCDHENTEGAWLCINCGGKLPRAEEAELEAIEAEENIEGAGSFDPTISENLRRLRERTASREPARPVSSRPPPAQSSGVERPPLSMPKLSGGSILGLSPGLWMIIGACIVIAFLTLSSLQ
jgi:hypothetical protein